MQYRNSTYGESSFDTYWFEKNLQGDIVAVYNEGGTKLVSYTYDAWGKIEISEHNLSGTNFNATYNPFRYRGYYYDSELGFYYLNSRYYDPETGRFISADGYISTGLGLIGNNMFAYCNNSSVIYMDEEGEFLCTAIGASVGFIFGAATAYAQGKRGRELWASAANGAVSGAISGAAADVILITGGSGAVVLGVYAAAGAIGSFAGSLVESAINNDDFTSGDVWKEAITSAVWGGLSGMLSAGMTGSVTPAITKATKEIGVNTFGRTVSTKTALGLLFKDELKNIGKSLVEETANNFYSWFSRSAFEHKVGWD